MGLLIGVGVGDRGVDRGSKARGQVHIDEAEALALRHKETWGEIHLLH